MISLSNIWLRTWDGPPQIYTAKVLVITSYPAISMVPNMHLYLCPSNSMVSLNLVFEDLQDTDKWNFSFSSCCEMPQSIFEFPDWAYCLATSKNETNIGAFSSCKMTTAWASSQTYAYVLQQYLMKQKTQSSAFCRILSVMHVLKVNIVLFFHVYK